MRLHFADVDRKQKSDLFPYILKQTFKTKMASWTVESFGPELVTKEGVVPTATALAGKSRIALYFSAHWVRIIFNMFRFYLL